MLTLPESFTRTVTSTFTDGAGWLERLPDTIDAYAQRWSLDVQPHFANLSYNYVAPATRADGTLAVLKLGVPNRELNTEIAALQHYAGRGMARLFEADATGGALLIERLLPGSMLSTLADDDAATLIAADVMRELWRPLPAEHPFPSVSDWAADLRNLRPTFNGGTGPFPSQLVDMAEQLFADLIASSSEPVLLHGDLHHYNILTATRQPWLAIDPKGIAGEPAYEVGALLRNELDHPQPQQLLARRVDLLADRLGLDKQRLAGWSVAQAMLSAWWSYEADQETGPWMQEMVMCAEALATLL